MTQKLKLGLCDNLEEWGGKEMGKRLAEGGKIGVPMADSC